MIRYVVVTVATASVLLAAGAAAGQERVTLVGAVRDSASGDPLENVLLLLDTGERAKSDAEGWAVLTDVLPGPHELTLVTPMCRTLTIRFRAPEGGRARIDLPVPRDPPPADLQPAPGKSSTGKIVTAEDLERMRARTLLDALRRVAPEMVGREPFDPGGSTRTRSRTLSVGSSSPPVVVVDGTPVWGTQILEQIEPSDVAAMEVFRGATGGWSMGTGGAGGLIRITTKSARGRTALGDPEQCLQR